jgi:hypothetical protein
MTGSAGRSAECVDAAASNAKTLSSLSGRGHAHSYNAAVGGTDVRAIRALCRKLLRVLEFQSRDLVQRARTSHEV